MPLAATSQGDWRSMLCRDGVRVIDFGIRGFDLVTALLDPYDVVIIVDTLSQGNHPVRPPRVRFPGRLDHRTPLARLRAGMALTRSRHRCSRWLVPSVAALAASSWSAVNWVDPSNQPFPGWG